MDIYANFYSFLIAVAVIGISIVILAKYMAGGRCKSHVNLRGKTVIVTGANSGIGKETARELAKRGARVILACRSLEKAKAAVEDIKQNSNRYAVAAQLDLTSFKSIRHFVHQVLSSEASVDILINNAGIVCGKSTTEDGVDAQFCTNHLGHFLLTYLLLDKLKASAPARIINVSSRIHLAGKMNWDDINMAEPDNYNSMLMYAQSKLANILFTKELARRLKGTGVNSYCLHPGVVMTELLNNLHQKSVTQIAAFPVSLTRIFLPFLWKTVQQGAQTSIYCAVATELENQSGLYYSDCAVTTPASNALDEEAAKKLWDVSLKMIGIEE